MAPPLPATELSLIVLLLTVTEAEEVKTEPPALFLMPPSTGRAPMLEIPPPELPLMVQLFTVNAALVLLMPPPPNSAELPLMVLLLSVTLLPKTEMPPPDCPSCR